MQVRPKHSLLKSPQLHHHKQANIAKAKQQGSIAMTREKTKREAATEQRAAAPPPPAKRKYVAPPFLNPA